MFKVIEDLAVADKLWEVGLLWIRTEPTGDWSLDTTYDYGSEYKPSNDTVRFPENTYEYAILIEE